MPASQREAREVELVDAGQDVPDGGSGTGAKWLDVLTGAGKPSGRLKGRNLQRLYVLAVIILAGLALMGVADLFHPVAVGGRADGDSGSAAGLAGSAGQAAGSTAEGANGAAGAAGLGAWISVQDLERLMEQTLERILSRIEGAGRVSVAVWLETGATYVYGYDESSTTQTSDERDSTGGSRVVTETRTTKEAVVVAQGSSSQPVVVRVDLPPVRGVVVVASGARDARVKALLVEAVRVLYGVAPHRVVVLAGS